MIMTTHMNMTTRTTRTTITATGSICNKTKIAALLPASSSSSSAASSAVAAPCNNNSVMMNSMQRRLLLLLIVVIMTAMTTTTTTAFSPQSSLKRRNGAIAFRSSSGSSSSSSSSVNSKTTTITGRTATVVNMSSGQDQQHNHNMITPMDGENAFQYLDPLKQFPSDELQEKLDKHNAMIDHLALCPSTSQKFASLPPSDCFIGGNSNSNSNNNMSRRPLVEHSAGLLLPPSSSSTSATSSSATNDGSSSSSLSLSSSHFQSHRKDLGWYAENKNENIPTTTTTDVPIVHYCDFDFFEFQKLTSKGPRKNSDIGTPEDYARPLCKDIPTSKSNTNSINSDSISCGSWYCTKGGWPSKTPRATTEIFYVWSGFGCVTDLDGQRNYFSPGDTVILPKHWSGRWDIAENVHKVWFVHDHEDTTTTSSSSVAGSTTSTTTTTTPSTIIRAKIIHYNELVSTTKKEELMIEPNTKVITKSIYNSSGGGEGPTHVMMSTSGPSSFVISPNQHTNCFHILEGSMMIILEDNNENGNGNGNNNKHKQIAVNVGDTIVLPIGWTGRFNVKETIKVLRVKV